MSSLRVVPPYRPRGLLPLAAALGEVSGVLTLALFVWLTTNYRAIDTFVSGLIVLVPLALLPPLLGGFLLSHLTQQPRLTTRAGLVFGAGQAFGFLVYTFATSETGGVIGVGVNLIIALTVLALFTLLGCGLFHVARFVTRSVLFVTVEQTGTLCHRCGYDRGTPSVAICPECATPADPTRFRAVGLLTLASMAHRVARPVAAVLLFISLVAAAHTFATRTVPAARFIRTFRTAGAHISRWFITPPNWPNWPPGTRCASAIGAWLPFPDGSDRVVLVLYAPDENAPEPAMQIAVAAGPAPPSRHAPPDFGSPQVAADLPRPLAERVARNGLPAEFLRAITAEADAGNWKPAGATGIHLITDAAFDPAPYFPPEESFVR